MMLRGLCSLSNEYRIHTLVTPISSKHSLSNALIAILLLCPRIIIDFTCDPNRRKDEEKISSTFSLYDFWESTEATPLNVNKVPYDVLQI